jgi:hypothetical protein
MEEYYHNHPRVQLRCDSSVGTTVLLDSEDLQTLTDHFPSLGPMLTPGLQTIAKQYNVSLDMVSSLMIGFFAFWIGSTTFFTAAGANVWGKRPFFLITTVILIGTCIWGFFAQV